MRSLGCQHTDVVFNIKHTVADGISNGNANGPFRNDFTSPVYLLCIIFLEVSTIFSFQLWKKEIEKRTKMKTCINISFPSKVRFRKKVHSQASDHVWSFRSSPLNTSRQKTLQKSMRYQRNIVARRAQTGLEAPPPWEMRANSDTPTPKP